MATIRKVGDVIAWTNNLSAGSGTVTKGSLVHLGKGMFGVAQDAIAFGATGNMIIAGEIEASALFTANMTVGQCLKNDSANIIAVTKLQIPVTASAGTTVTFSNLRVHQAVTAATAAQTVRMKLVG
jgi:predicted RecA/RadA family phage recombinase